VSDHNRRLEMSQQNDKGLHPRNLHKDRYDFEALSTTTPELKNYVATNPHGDLSIDFSDPQAVITLNKALLAHFYKVKVWSIPKGHLCPPIPGRADYLHHMADLLGRCHGGVVPYGKEINVLDIGVGANGIYPLIGRSFYSWRFVGSDIDAKALANVAQIVNDNEILDGGITLRHQEDSERIFDGIIAKNDRFDFTLCNPPFHRSAEEAAAGSQRKVRNLTKDKSKKAKLNFGGQANELWCPGGEAAFIRKMIEESKLHAKKVFWFSTLVSKKENLPNIYKALVAAKSVEYHTIEMKHGQKVTRIVFWTYLSKVKQKAWVKARWS